MKLHYPACLLACLALAVPAAAQTGTVRGKVVDDQGRPLEAAKVELDFLGGITRHFETKTNKKGEYTQVGLQPGTYKITANKEGFQGSFLEIRVSVGDPTYLPELKLVGLAAAAGLASSRDACAARSRTGHGCARPTAPGGPAPRLPCRQAPWAGIGCSSRRSRGRRDDRSRGDPRSGRRRQ